MPHEFIQYFNGAIESEKSCQKRGFVMKIETSSKKCGIYGEKVNSMFTKGRFSRSKEFSKVLNKIIAFKA